MAPAKNDYQPKQAQRIPRKLKNVQGDGDMWVQRCVYDTKGRPRCFFQSVRTDECHWDEPPSGATRIVLADELHKYPFLHKRFFSAPAPKPPSDGT